MNYIYLQHASEKEYTYADSDYVTYNFEFPSLVLRENLRIC